jgi:phosphatidylserine decarboxylase
MAMKENFRIYKNCQLELFGRYRQWFKENLIKTYQLCIEIAKQLDQTDIASNGEGFYRSMVASHRSVRPVESACQKVPEIVRESSEIVHEYFLKSSSRDSISPYQISSDNS